MGNSYGVWGPNLKLSEVGEAMRTVLDASFPGVFQVFWGDEDGRYSAVTVYIGDQRILEWGKEYKEGFIGGRSSDMAEFGDWFLSEVRQRVAVHLGVYVYDDFWREAFIVKPEGISVSFPAYMAGCNRMKIQDSVRNRVPPELLPYFEGKTLPPVNFENYAPPEVQFENSEE